ncbi:MAG: electron transfer flavoprotein subunit beta/FixA family protein [Elusimicrobia bacterium]|nr:electron transfer flavoprotein subunit beta/FixA family protein [Elusimicrobiota bacterium]
MPLNIVVCIKQTPATGSVSIDPQTGDISKEGISYAISPFDEYALEEGLRLKERFPGGATLALTMGAVRAEEILREAIARGVDGVYHLCDEAFDGSDTFATSYILSQGIRKIEEERKIKIDLVICAKQTNDGDTGQVGPGLAAWLDWPNTAYVKKVEQVTDTLLRVHRMMEDGTDILEIQRPALISVVKEINEPRLPSLKGKMAAKKAVIPRWGASDIKADPALIGLKGSLVEIAKRQSPPKRAGGLKIGGATIEEKAKIFVDKLRELKLL